jgi:hypothetical protein
MSIVDECDQGRVPCSEDVVTASSSTCQLTERLARRQMTMMCKTDQQLRLRAAARHGSNSVFSAGYRQVDNKNTVLRRFLVSKIA